MLHCSSDVTFFLDIILMALHSSFDRQLVCEYHWNRAVCCEDLVLLSSCRTFLNCCHIHVDLRLLSNKVRECFNNYSFYSCVYPDSHPSLPPTSA